MWAEVTALVLAAGTAFYVARPLFSSARLTIAGAREDSLEDRKIEVYESLRDLEYDRQMQKISADDYAKLRHQLANEALMVLSRLGNKARLGGSRGVDPLEEEIARYRSNRRLPEATPNSIACPRCKRSQPKENRFCGHCGARLASTTPEEDSDAS